MYQINPEFFIVDNNTQTHNNDEPSKDAGDY